jgi:hypothetical protein
MFETAYFILDFLHLRKVLQQKKIETKKSVQKSISTSYHLIVLVLQCWYLDIHYIG